MHGQPSDPAVLTIDDAELAGWTALAARCATCRSTSLLPWMTLRRHGRTRLLDIAGALRCHRCGERPATVALYRLDTSRPAGDPEARVEMVIWGK